MRDCRCFGVLLHCRRFWKFGFARNCRRFGTSGFPKREVVVVFGVPARGMRIICRVWTPWSLCVWLGSFIGPLARSQPSECRQLGSPFDRSSNKPERCCNICKAVATKTQRKVSAVARSRRYQDTDSLGAMGANVGIETCFTKTLPTSRQRRSLSTRARTRQFSIA